MDFENMPINEQFFAGIDKQTIKISQPWPHDATDRVQSSPALAATEYRVTTEATPGALGSNDQLGLVPERTYTRQQLLTAIEAERHACSIAVWMTLQDALAEDADDMGLDGWMREAERRVKNRSANDGDACAMMHAQIQAKCRKALRPVECSHTGMSYGDDKAGGPDDYTRGWGDCLKAVKAALGLVA